MLINAVAPFAGAWIEIVILQAADRRVMVAPFAGAWIEIHNYPARGLSGLIVAPFAGAWIEIELKRHSIDKIWSLPSRERGLK